MEYGHGTGHGIGAYLNVHEGPAQSHGSKSMEDLPFFDYPVFRRERFGVMGISYSLVNEERFGAIKGVKSCSKKCSIHQITALENLMMF